MLALTLILFAPDLGPAHAELEAAYEQIQRELLAEKAPADADISKFIGAMTPTVERVLAPLKSRLLKRGAWRLAQAPAARLDRSKYTAVEAAGPINELLKTLSPEMLKAAPAEVRGALQVAWDPIRVAALLRGMLQARGRTPAEVARHSLIENIAPPRYRVLDAKPEAPVIAAFFGAEVFVVHLWVEPSLKAYLPSKIEWLRER